MGIYLFGGTVSLKDIQYVGVVFGRLKTHALFGQAILHYKVVYSSVVIFTSIGLFLFPPEGNQISQEITAAHEVQCRYTQQKFLSCSKLLKTAGD